jgi:TonB-linked SusC/RagA family outer membrane protein
MKKLRILITQVFGYGYKKYLLIMKITTLLCFLSLLPISATVYSQNTSLSLKVTNKTVKEVLEQIEQESKFHFLYNDNYVDLDKKVDLEVNNMNIHDVLDQLLKGSSSSYKVLDNNLVVIAPVEIMQQQKVTGKVVDSTTGEPLIGVNVIIEGTTIGVTSDVNGGYSIDVSNNNAVLVFTFVGYNSERVVVNGRSVIDINLIPDITKLEEVVVVGYGTIKKRDLTGAVASVKASEIKRAFTSSADQMLQGRASGVMIQQNSTAPGAGMTIRVRGDNSINGGNDPLFVIDGQIINNDNSSTSAVSAYNNTLQINPLSLLNPNDIESMEVLKDASATAIYGARGSNGVIIITTKRGNSSGKSVVEFNVSYGIQKTAKRYEMLNSREWMEFNNDAIANSLKNGIPDPAMKPIFGATAMDSRKYDTDWQKEILHNSAPVQDYQLSLRGGNDNLQYMLSMNYADQKAISKGSGMKKYSVRLNLDKKALNYLNLGTSMTVSRQEYEGSVGIDGGNNSEMFRALRRVPIVPGKYPGGYYSYQETDVYNNDSIPREGGGKQYTLADAKIPIDRPGPLYMAEALDNKVQNNRILGNVYAEVVILPSLKFKTTFGVDLIDRKTQYYEPSNGTQRPTGGAAEVGYGTTTFLSVENNLSFNKTLKKHSISAILVQEAQKSITDASRIRGEGLNDMTTYYSWDGNYMTSNIIFPSGSTWTIASFLGRINYSFNSKYLITATYRADGSSRFGANNKWAYFPSVSLGWVLSREPFMQQVASINNLKLRAGYGEVGSQDVGLYKSLSTLGTATYIVGTTKMYGRTLSQIPNPDLQWERNKQYNIGMDIELFQNRIAFSADFYVKNTDNLLYDRALPLTSGFGSITENIGEVKNTGMEFSLTTYNLTGNLKWNTSVNFSYNKNEVVKLNDGITEKIGDIILRVGEPIGSYYGYKTDGIYKSTDDIAHSSQPLATPGERKFKNIYTADNDSLITPKDRTILGSYRPKFIFGINNNFSYKNFDLNIFFQGVAGRKLYNETRSWLLNQSGTVNVSEDMLNRWTPTNENTNIPKAIYTGSRNNYGSNLNDYFVEDASYLRLKNVTLTYHLPERIAGKIGSSSIRIFLSGQNLATFTRYKGLDPDVSSDNAGLPPIKIYTAGFNITF